MNTNVKVYVKDRSEALRYEANRPMLGKLKDGRRKVYEDTFFPSCGCINEKKALERMEEVRTDYENYGWIIQEKGVFKESDMYYYFLHKAKYE